MYPKTTRSTATINIAIAAQLRTDRGVRRNVRQVRHRIAVRLTRREQWGHNFFGLFLTNELNSSGATKNKKAPRSITELPICLTAHDIRQRP